MTTHHPATTTPWEALITLRVKDGHTKSSLARAAGMSISYLGQLERGIRRPTPRVIKILADTLNVPVSVLEPRYLTEPRAPQDAARDILTELIRAQEQQHTRGDAA